MTPRNEARLIGAWLRERYGVEDIAVKTGFDEKRVRQWVRHWRETGELKHVLMFEDGTERLCKRGHPKGPKNSREGPTGLVCRVCKSAWDRRHRAKRLASDGPVA